MLCNSLSGWYGQPVRRPLLSLAVPLVVCAGAGIAALADRGGDPALSLKQQQLQRLTPAAVDALVATAPDPRGAARPHGTARCVAGSSGDLRNPWSCGIRYPDGFTARYRVTIRADGSYVGQRLDDAGQITGCCLALGNIG